MKTDEERIKLTAKYILEALETPIKGEPSVVVKNRENAERLIEVALLEVLLSIKRASK